MPSQNVNNPHGNVKVHGARFVIEIFPMSL
jgi:hypothetical protein